MNEDHKNPKSAKKWFNLEAEDKVVAEKDSTNMQPNPPDFIIEFVPEFAPIGSVSVQRNNKNNSANLEPETPKEEPIDTSRDDISLEWEDHDHTIIVKQEDEQWEKGIEGGRISRLVLIKDDDPVVAFQDGKWVEPPESPLHIQMVDEIKDDLNDTPKKEFKGFHDPDPDNDLDI